MYLAPLHDTRFRHGTPVKNRYSNKSREPELQTMTAITQKKIHDLFLTKTQKSEGTNAGKIRVECDE